MSIPLATTTVKVERVESPANTDGYDPAPPAPTTVASGVRANIGPASANAALSGGQRVVYSATLQCDVCDLADGDTVTDANGTVWLVLWAERRTAVGLDFMVGEVRRVLGAT